MDLLVAQFTLHDMRVGCIYECVEYLDSYSKQLLCSSESAGLNLAKNEIQRSRKAGK